MLMNLQIGDLRLQPIMHRGKHLGGAVPRNCYIIIPIPPPEPRFPQGFHVSSAQILNMDKQILSSHSVIAVKKTQNTFPNQQIFLLALFKTRLKSSLQFIDSWNSGAPLETFFPHLYCPRFARHSSLHLEDNFNNDTIYDPSNRWVFADFAMRSIQVSSMLQSSKLYECFPHALHSGLHNTPKL